MRLLHRRQAQRLPCPRLTRGRRSAGQFYTPPEVAHFMLEQGLIAREKLADVDAESADGIFYRGKMETVRFFCRNILPNVFARHAMLQQEDTSAMDIPEEAL